MSKIRALTALAGLIAPLAAIAADPITDGAYTHYSPRTNHCYLIETSGGEVQKMQTYYSKDCTGSPFADWPVTHFKGGWTADDQSWYIHGWTADSIDVRFDTPAARPSTSS